MPSGVRPGSTTCSRESVTSPKWVLVDGPWLLLLRLLLLLPQPHHSLFISYSPLLVPDRWHKLNSMRDLAGSALAHLPRDAAQAWVLK